MEGGRRGREKLVDNVATGAVLSSQVEEKSGLELAARVGCYCAYLGEKTKVCTDEQLKILRDGLGTAQSRDRSMEARCKCWVWIKPVGISPRADLSRRAIGFRRTYRMGTVSP